MFNSKSHKKDISFERLEKVYHPLFLKIESNLYKKNIELEELNSLIAKFNKINNQYSLYIDPDLKYYINELSDKDNYTSDYIITCWLFVCRHIDHTYDKLCKLCNIPIRNRTYRVRNRQYESKPKLFLHIFILTFPQTLIFFILLYFAMNFILSL